MPHDLLYTGQFLAAALLTSLLCVSVLVGLFFYLNHYTRRDYFTIWGVAWLFYGLWLLLRTTAFNAPLQGWAMIIGHCYLGTSAVFLLWGALRFMGAPTPQRSMALFLVFVYSWAYASADLVEDRFWREMPIFGLAGLASLCAAAGFYRAHVAQRSAGADLLTFGFALWTVYLLTSPCVEGHPWWGNLLVLFSSGLQLFIGVSMIVLMLEEARASTQRISAEMEAVKSEKVTLQDQILSAEAEFRNIFGQSGVSGDLHSAYEQLRQTQQNVVQQERLRALGQMASGIAHDINNSLTPIIGYSDYLLDSHAANSDESRKCLQYIRSAAADIANMVEQVRHFYRRREDNEPLPALDVNSLARDVLAAMPQRWADLPAANRCTIVPELTPDLPRVRESESELREALVHLLQNAVDAMPQGGTLTLATRLVHRPAVEEGTEPDVQVALEVRDTGIGMDDLTRQRCLEPFFSTKGPRRSGLGLSMVYGMIRRHKGHMEIESKPGDGSTVRLLLNPGEGVAAPPVDDEAPGLRLPPLRVLCIDDDRRVGAMLRRVLASQQHLVEVAEGGENGLAAFRAARWEGRSFQVVITDLNMPDMDGRQIVQAVKRESPETPVIVLTGWGSAAVDQTQELPGNVDAVVSKPAHIHQLFQALARVTKPCAA